MAPTEDQYWQLLEEFPDQNVVVDDEGVVIFADSGFKQVSGCNSEDIVGTALHGLVYDADSDDVRDALEAVGANPDTAHQFEFRTQTIEGEWRILEAIGRTLPSQSPISGIVVTVRDITERKQRERELQAQNDRLEEFAEIVSHDLRSPLQVAQGHLEQAAATGSEDSFEKVRQSHDRIGAIIDDVLTLARQGKSVGETEPVSLAEIARRAWETVETKEMELVVQDDKELEADPDRFQQLLENLFRNAAEHAGPETTVTVGPLDLMATSTRAEEDLATGFFLADDGSGLPDADVFESGFSTESDGTGFGLAIVEQIAEAHHWCVSEKESLDGGARFEFTEIPKTERLQPSHGS
ncbi:PAS domain S-box protein [Halovenus amylolytica]|uniref:PAS domain S-box protein n=1 Tax=Halovenus amylolytica TaxID=2500550 RepID=UPI00361F6414